MFENQLEQQIISLYDNNLKSLYSINHISKRLKKTYPYINRKVKSMICDRILNRRIIGRSYLCSLNFSNEKTIVLLTLYEINKKRMLEKRYGVDFSKITHLNESFRIHLGVVLLDDNCLLIVCDDAREKEGITRKMKCLLKFKSKVVSREEFMKRLISNNGSLFTNHVVVYGYERFFEFIMQADKELSRIYSPFT